MDEIQETQLQAEIGRAPSEESSGKRKKLENQEEEIQEKGVLSHAERFQMTSLTATPKRRFSRAGEGVEGSSASRNSELEPGPRLQLTSTVACLRLSMLLRKFLLSKEPSTFSRLSVPFTWRLLRGLRAEGAFRPAFWHWLETKMSCCRAEFRSHTWLRPVFDGASGVIVWACLRICLHLVWAQHGFWVIVWGGGGFFLN